MKSVERENKKQRLEEECKMDEYEQEEMGVFIKGISCAIYYEVIGKRQYCPWVLNLYLFESQHF